LPALANAYFSRCYHSFLNKKCFRFLTDQKPFSMKKKSAKKLTLRKETLQHMAKEEQMQVQGGATAYCAYVTTGCFLTTACVSALCVTAGCVTAGCGTLGCGSDFTRPGGR
jgi:hypothetical protein